MSKLSTRKTLALIITLVAILALFTSVQGASSGVGASKTGSHLVSGAMVNLNHDRFTASELETYNAQLDAYYGDSAKGGGHGCESEARAHSDY